MPTRHSITVTGIGTTVLPLSTAGEHRVIVKLQLPTPSEGASGPSAVITTITQNSTLLFTSNAGDEGAMTPINVAANDTLSVAFASSAAVDQGANAFKATITIG